MRLHSTLLAMVLVASSVPIVEAEPLQLGEGSELDLSGPFATRSAWHIGLVQGPPVDFDGDKVPGEIRLCLTRPGSGACDPQLRQTLRPDTADGPYSQPHYLQSAELVRPRGDARDPLLMVRTASLSSMTNDQLILTQLLAYRAERDGFLRVYEHVTGRNNDQEVRYVPSGPLRGDVISAEPTGDAPFGFWILVSRYASGRPYQQVLRYRSATRYGDNNPLPVIDSDMAEIQQRLGLWHPGMSLPLPAAPCPKPHLKAMELWCG